MSAKYREFQQLNLPSIEAEILKLWDDQQAFETSVSIREGAPSFVFYEGPPSANGMPGIHHVISRTLKDLVCRYKTMQGYEVKRKGGWDTHGLPVELGVEKMLGITKEDIGKKISIAEYNETCRKEVLKYKDKWDDLTRKMGYWVDLDNPYITFKTEYIETLWWILKQLYQKGYLYESVSIQPYSPAMRIVVFVFFNFECTIFFLQLNAYVHVYINIIFLVFIILHIPVTEFAETIHKFSLPVNHCQDTNAIFLSNSKVICAKCRCCVYYTSTIFCCYKVTDQYAKGIATTLLRTVGFIRKKLFITDLFEL